MKTIFVKSKKKALHRDRYSTIVLAITINKQDVVVKDYALIESTNDSGEVSYTPTQINSKAVTISDNEYNSLYAYIERQLPRDLTPLEKQVQMEELSALFYIQSNFIKDENGDKIDGVTLYGIPYNQWELADSLFPEIV